MGKNGDFWEKIVIFSRGADQKCLESSPMVLWVQIHVSLLIPTCTIKSGMNIIIFHTENYLRKWDKVMLHTEKYLRNRAKTHDN